MSAAVQPAPRDTSRGGKYLTFFLGGEEYGVSILRVQEIVGMQAITRVPRTPGFILGVVNLRGRVVPVVDLRERFGMAPTASADVGGAEPDARAAALRCIVVVEVSVPDESGRVDARIPMGVVADRVSEVASVEAEAVEDPPSFGAAARTDFLLGVATGGRRVLLLLDVDRVLARADARAVQSVHTVHDATPAA